MFIISVTYKNGSTGTIHVNQEQHNKPINSFIDREQVRKISICKK